MAVIYTLTLTRELRDRVGSRKGQSPQQCAWRQNRHQRRTKQESGSVVTQTR